MNYRIHVTPPIWSQCTVTDLDSPVCGVQSTAMMVSGSEERWQHLPVCQGVPRHSSCGTSGSFATSDHNASVVCDTARFPDVTV